MNQTKPPGAVPSGTGLVCGASTWSREVRPCAEPGQNAHLRLLGFPACPGRGGPSRAGQLFPVRGEDTPRREQMSRVLVSGAAGFIGGYVVEELLSRGHEVIGLDNLSKYGPVAKSYDRNPGYRFVQGDARDVPLLTGLLADCDHFVAGAAMIGGISYFHAYAYDLLATNERIIAASCDAAIDAHQDHHLQKVTYLSSSMVYESAELLAFRGGTGASDPSAKLRLRIPEAGGRVLRARRPRPARPPLHHRPAVQLRRRR